MERRWTRAGASGVPLEQDGGAIGASAGGREKTYLLGFVIINLLYDR